MELLGYIGAILIGLTLGLIGGGGSILAVPILVYLFGIDAVTATAYSLFIVGLTSALGGVQKAVKGYVDFGKFLLFGIPSMIAVTFTRHSIIPAIPDQVFTIGNYVVQKDALILLVFSVVMVAASYSMIVNGKKDKEPINAKGFWKYILIILEGLIVGALTGFVGAGGGFLIIPALVLLTGLDMKTAVGTSLLIIAFKSLVGFFLGDVGQLTIDWLFLTIFTAIAIAGIIMGSFFNKNVSGSDLKRIFGWFVLVMGLGIIIAELI